MSARSHVHAPELDILQVNPFHYHTAPEAYMIYYYKEQWSIRTCIRGQKVQNYHHFWHYGRSDIYLTWCSARIIEKERDGHSWLSWCKKLKQQGIPATKQCVVPASHFRNPFSSIHAPCGAKNLKQTPEPGDPKAMNEWIALPRFEIKNTVGSGAESGVDRQHRPLEIIYVVCALLHHTTRDASCRTRARGKFTVPHVHHQVHLQIENHCTWESN